MIVTCGVTALMFSAEQNGAAYAGKYTMSFASALFAQVVVVVARSFIAAALAEPAKRDKAARVRERLEYIFKESGAFTPKAKR